MDIHHLRVFASVYKNRSFSKASEELHLTQPTISDHIRALEDELGCKLFDRLGRTNVPTREAEVLHDHVVEILEKIGSLKDAFSKLKKEVTGELIIGASTIPGTYLMPRIITDFKKKYPSVFFQIVESDSKEIIQKLLRQELLVGIVGAKLVNSQLNFIPFTEEELIVVSSPSLVKRSSMKLEEIVELPVVLREEGSGTRKEMEKILESMGISLDGMKIAGLFGSTDAVKQAVKAGLGISVISKLSVADELKYKTLKEIRLTDIEMKRTFYIVTHRKRTLPFVYGIFLEYLKTYR